MNTMWLQLLPKHCQLCHISNSYYLWVWNDFALHSGDKTLSHLLNFLCIYFYTDLLTSNQQCVYAILYIWFILPSNKCQQHTPQADISHSISIPPGINNGAFWMSISKAKLKRNGNKASPCFKPIWIGEVLQKLFNYKTFLKVTFKHILNSSTRPTANQSKQYCTILPS